MTDIPDFQRKQYQLAAWIRDPDHSPPPAGIEARRLAIYRRLFQNNLASLLSSTFPVLRQLHSNEQWNKLIREFMIEHRAESPYFLEVPEEFLLFLQQRDESADSGRPFMLELAHYEWVELALSISDEDNDIATIDRNGDLLGGIPVKSKQAWALSYNYPVHRISAEFQPPSPPATATFLAVYRRLDLTMGFLELNPVSARLLELLDDNATTTGKELLIQLASELEYPDTDQFITHGNDILQQMYRLDIVLGTREGLND